MVERCYLGVDVGTGSVRAALFDGAGRRLGLGTHDIRISRPREGFVEQSSDDIWSACGKAVRRALEEASLAADRVRGIGFDATCSLVALDGAGRPVTVSPGGDDEWNVVVWMDHRAREEARSINASPHRVLEYVGGRISPEMQIPKLLWLRQNLPGTWRRAKSFLDLPDFLVYRATGEDVRSLCTTTCKWTYLAHERKTGVPETAGWEAGFFEAIGLQDLVREGYSRIGTRIRPQGERVGRGLTEAAARELGLLPGTAVGVAIIDAHAGGLGLLGMPLSGKAPGLADLEERLALILGTSSCHMAVSREPHRVPGVWGPYHSAMIPGMWLTEGGQSATGALIDHVIFSHARGAELREEALRKTTSVYALLNEVLERLSRDRAAPPATLTRDLHVYPDFHGNRSPRADPDLRGMVSGLTLTDSVESLALLYLATIQAIAHGTRHIVSAMNEAGHRIRILLACGGDTRNPVFVREHADVTGLPIVLPREKEAVLLGSAMLGAVATGDFASPLLAMSAMAGVSETIRPTTSVKPYHDAKHAVFHRMHADQVAYREMLG